MTNHPINHPINIEVQIGPSSTRYIITGSREAVDGKLRGLKQQYPSQGYGTWSEYTPDGAMLVRSNSCE